MARSRFVKNKFWRKKQKKKYQKIAHVAGILMHFAYFGKEKGSLFCKSEPFFGVILALHASRSVAACKCLDLGNGDLVHITLNGVLQGRCRHGKFDRLLIGVAV